MVDLRGVAIARPFIAQAGESAADFERTLFDQQRGRGAD